MFEGIARRIGWANQSMGRFLIGCMVIGFASLVAAGIAAVWSTGRNQEHIRAVNHTYEIELAIDRAHILVEQAESVRRGRQPVANHRTLAYCVALAFPPATPHRSPSCRRSPAVAR